MEIENLGEIADVARDYVYSDWHYYQCCKASGFRGSSETFRCWFKMCELVEAYYGKKPKGWK